MIKCGFTPYVKHLLLAEELSIVHITSSDQPAATTIKTAINRPVFKHFKRACAAINIHRINSLNIDLEFEDDCLF